ncbi:hypothetical protein IQ249_03080 [Lusitaniella coriacea LEGE 07157]|uniref:Uncharacterized protein n=1 Tax=Lusitaniella coriacea LEGE 07157 TaxID=945747 RepID=A0A8J7AN59_9CYAN|nr:hypothetical protein [Lusitaniella coriacea]MBE9114873.1 hypothetical protein [Lusitaniella coriacea LEGE 07157]
MSSNALTLHPILPPTQVLSHLHSGQLLRIDAPRGSAMIICHRHHAEIAGPGAAIGGVLDIDCYRAIPIGKVALVYPESAMERREAFLVRHQWIESTQRVANYPVPLQRATIILKMLRKYCGAEAFSYLPDDAIAQLVGVLPQTIVTARKHLDRLTRKSVSRTSSIAV